MKRAAEEKHIGLARLRLKAAKGFGQPEPTPFTPSRYRKISPFDCGGTCWMCDSHKRFGWQKPKHQRSNDFAADSGLPSRTRDLKIGG